MNRLNLNNDIVIYPNEEGWKKINELTRKAYNLSDTETEDWLDRRKTENNGLKEQLWVIIDLYHSMFFNGQRYLETAYIDLVYPF